MSNAVEVDGMSFPSAIKAIEFFSKEKELSEKLFEEIANKIKTVSKHYVKQVLIKNNNNYIKPIPKNKISKIHKEVIFKEDEEDYCSELDNLLNSFSNEENDIIVNAIVGNIPDCVKNDLIKDGLLEPEKV